MFLEDNGTKVTNSWWEVILTIFSIIGKIEDHSPFTIKNFFINKYTTGRLKMTVRER